MGHSGADSSAALQVTKDLRSHAHHTTPQCPLTCRVDHVEHLLFDGSTHWELLADVQHIVELNVHTVCGSDWEEGCLGNTE